MVHWILIRGHLFWNRHLNWIRENWKRGVTSNQEQSKNSLQLISFCFGSLLLGLPSRNGVFHPNEKQQSPEEGHILQGVQYLINCNDTWNITSLVWAFRMNFFLKEGTRSYLSKFDEKLNKFFVLAVIIVEIIQYRSSNQLMQKLQGENNQGFKNWALEKATSMSWVKVKLQTKRKAPKELPSMKRIPPMPLRAIAPATKNFIC